MPFLDPRSHENVHISNSETWIADGGNAGDPQLLASAGVRNRSGFFDTCANPGCRSGWLHLWRGRSTPVFEGGWTCSAECTKTRMQNALAREMEGRATTRALRRHRIPVGLLMLEQGWISQNQLRRALDAQKAAGKGRLGYWLVRQGAVSEEAVTRALALQWSCPVMPLDGDEEVALTVVMPRLFVDAFGALPLRIAAEKILYLGFEESLDLVLALAISRMIGLRTEIGVVRESLFRSARARFLDSSFAPVELIEAVSRTAAAHVLARSIERVRPVESRLVRVHDCIWLRLWLRPQKGVLPEIGSVQDIVCSIGAIRPGGD